MSNITNIKRSVYLKENLKKVESLKVAAIQNRQPRIDIDLIEQAFKPFSQRLAAANFDKEDAGEVTDAVINLMSGMSIELINQFIPLSQLPLAQEFGQQIVNTLADQLSDGLNAIYATKHS